MTFSLFKRAPAAIAAAFAMWLCACAHAATLRYGHVSDANSMDPHALNELTQISVMGNVYEPLVTRSRDHSLAPGLATAWQQTAPTRWRFDLRKGVRFHDGTPFTADDVVFSWQRAAGEGSDVKIFVAGIRGVKKLGEHAVEIETVMPNPILPDQITHWLIMSRSWCEANQATLPVDRRRGIENAASFKANGTGPFRLRERQPGLRTVFTRHGLWWGRFEGNVEEVVFTPITSDATRLAALVSGAVDVIEPVSLNDIERLESQPGFAVLQAPENRVWFLGMDQRRAPFNDRRVRLAVWQAIDTDTLRRQLLRGTGLPAALLATPQMKGYDARIDQRPPFDPAAARRLLADAGHANGLEVRFNCPVERSNICQAVAASLARVGITATVAAEPRAVFLPKLLRRELALYLTSAGTPTADSHYTMQILMHSPGEGGLGTLNGGSYSNPRVDELTRAVGAESDPAKRLVQISEAMRLHRDEVGHVPLYQATVNRGTRKGVEMVLWPDNIVYWKYVKVPR